MSDLRHTSLILMVCLVIKIFCAMSLDAQRFDYPNILDFHYIPENADSEPIYFSSNGAMFGFTLPDDNNPEFYGSFIGPYSIATGKWISESMIKFSVSDGKKREFKDAKHMTIRQYPGLLYQQYIFDDIIIEQNLCFISGRSALITNNVINISDKEISLALRLDGIAFENSGIGSEFASSYRFELLDGNDLFLLIRFKSSGDVSLGIHPEYYEYGHTDLQLVKPGDTLSMNITLSQYYFKDPFLDTDLTGSALAFPSVYKQRVSELWNNYLSRFSDNVISLYKTPVVKALQIFMMRLRAPSYRIPDYYVISGFSHNSEYIKTDDSWLFAAALSRLDPQLALEHISAVMRHQRPNGSLPRIIYTGAHNDEDSISSIMFPMLCRTAFNLFNITADGDFGIGVIPLLEDFLKYYQTNDDNIWVLNKKREECPVLNALLYSEYHAFETLCRIIHEYEKADYYQQKQQIMKKEFNQHFFDKNLNAYIIRKPADTAKIISEDAGMFALWTGLAEMEIATVYAQHYTQILSDVNKIQEFRSSPADAFQTWVLISGLKNYGLSKLADAYMHEFMFKILDEQFLQQTGVYKNIFKPEYRRSDVYSVLLLFVTD